MKIGLIAGEFPPMPGGVGRYAEQLGEGLQQHHEVQVLSRHGCDSEALPISTISGWGLQSYAPIQEWVNRHQFDAVNLQFQTAAYDMSPFVHFLPSIIDPPLITSFHDLRHPYLFPKAGRLRSWIVRRLARASAGVITTNQEDHQQLQGLPHLRLIPIGSGILSAPAGGSRSHWRAQLGADDSTFLLAHFGFIKAIKGIDYLLDALAELRGQGWRLRLAFIGERSNRSDGDRDMPYLRQVETRIRQLALDDAVHWTGFLPEAEVAACLKAADLIALPFLDGASYRRSSLIAAGHYGCAILTTQPPIATAAFQHKQNMWLIGSHSAAQIAEAVRHLMQHPQQLAALRRGAAALRQHFDWDAIARDTASFFETLLP